jgi:uncharacterized protein (TIGR03437 family)
MRILSQQPVRKLSRVLRMLNSCLCACLLTANALAQSANTHAISPALTTENIQSIQSLMVGGSSLAGEPSAGRLVAVNAASYLPRLAPGGIAAAFGTRLTEQTAMAERQPLPFEIGQLGVRLLDSQQQPFSAPLFFVSPSQINFLVPDQIATGQAQLFLTSGDEVIAQGEIMISNTAPALFTYSGNGKGIPAALTTADGESYTALMNLDGTPRAITPGNVHRPQYLLLFGTGFRYAYNVKIKLGGVTLKPLYSGAQGSLSGLDQINLELPPDLKPGLLELLVISDGNTSNPVQVQINSLPKSSR